jgi:predicted small metal-binding protein
MKRLRCRDLGFACDHEIRAASVEEILQQAAAHAREVHDVAVRPELAEQVRTLIKEESEV